MGSIMKMNGSGCVFDHCGRVPPTIYTPQEPFCSPLEEAVYKNDIAAFKDLIKEGNKVTVKLCIGQMTCLEYAALQGYSDMLKLLIEQSSNAATLQQYFALNDVVDRAYMMSRNKDLFFEGGALAEANRYEAALYTAVEYNQPGCVRVMLEVLGKREPNKHDFFTKGSAHEHLGAIQLAEVRDHRECHEILKRWHNS